jgi:hypothetical protein
MSSKAYPIISTTFENDKKAMVEKRLSSLTPSFDIWNDTHIIQHLNIQDADQWGVVRITQVELALIKKEEPVMTKDEVKALKSIEADFEEANKKGFKFVEYICY